MCVVCARPLSTSAGDAADDQREVMQALIDEGLTKDQIKDRLVVEYGRAVLVDDDSPWTTVGPLLAAIVGLGSVILLLRRRGRPDGDEAADGAAGRADDAGSGPAAGDDAGGDHAAPAEPAPLDAADEARIDAELAERG